MSDEDKIRQLLATYVQKTDDFDARGKSDLFAEDGKYYPASGEVVGREAIYNTTADAATDYVVYRRVGEDPWQIMQIGRYYDRFVRRGDTWFFSENRPVKLGP